jgi:very-short-patch-repair endonuclease
MNDITVFNEHKDFSFNLENLIEKFNTQKVKLVQFLIKNFKENIHFIIIKNNKNLNNTQKRGGHNKKDYFLTEYTYNLIKNSYNLRNNYITNISDNIKCVNIIMSLENSTIGFIFNSLNGVIDVKRQIYFGSYRVDLYFPEHNLVVECDENNHNDREPLYEKTRENYILSLGKTIIRYNPNDKNFELSMVLNEIIYKKEIKTNLIIVNF